MRFTEGSDQWSFNLFAYLFIYLFIYFIYYYFNNSLLSSNFPSKLQIFCQHITRKTSQILRTIVQLVFFLHFLRSMKDICMTKCINTFTKFFLKINAVFAKVIILSIVYWWWLRNGKKPLDKDGLGGALLTDLSKAFDCIKHDLLIPELAAYGFDSHSLSFVFSCLNEREQRTKLHNSCSPYANIACGFPQESILAPLLLNINICDMFLKDTNVILPATLIITHPTHMTQICTLS